MSNFNFHFNEPTESQNPRVHPEREHAGHVSHMAEHKIQNRYTRELRNAHLCSEIRHIGARLTTFCQQLEPFIGVELDSKQESALVGLYSRFSAEIDILEAAALQIDGGDRTISSMADVLRTPLEEGILSYRSNQASSYRDPHYVKKSLVRGYRSVLYSYSGALKALSPTSTQDCYSLGAHIEEYGNNRQPISPQKCAELLGLINSRVIDRTREEPQEGFGRECTESEFRGFLQRESTLCCVPSDVHGPLGLYVFDTDKRNIPDAARSLIEQYAKGGPLTDQDGWVDVIALAATARDRLRGPLDVWYLACEYHGEGAERNGSLALREVALLPCDASNVGPGDYILDTSGMLHQISDNSAFGNAHPRAWAVTTTKGRTIDMKEVDTYLRTQELSSRLPCAAGVGGGSTLHLAGVLTRTSVTDVGSGDFVRDKEGVLREISSNSAQGQRHPKSWQITTTDGHTFGMFDISCYLARQQATEEILRSHKPPSLYRWLTLTACETACTWGLSTLWCQVRVGPQGNTAREKHLAVGWEATGLIIANGTREFEVLRLDPFKIITGLSDDDVTRLRQHQIEYQPEAARLRELAEDAWSSHRGELPDDHFIEIISNRFPNCSRTHSSDSLGRLQVTLNSESKNPLFFQQGLAGHDLWRVQRDPEYSLSLYNPLSSLEQTIARDHEQLCSRALKR